MEYKAFPSKVEEVIDERTIKGISSVIGVLDDGLDLIHKGAFVKTLDERSDRIKHLWQHDFSKPPVATVVDIQEIGRTDLPKDMKEKYPNAKGGLMVVRRYLETERGNEVLAGLKSTPQAITEMSIGYDPVKFDFEEIADGEQKGVMIRNLREIRLWDTSDVNWGMNAATIANVKMAIPFKDTGVADEGMDWSKPTLSDCSDTMNWADLTDGEKRRIAAHFAWTANNPPESFGDLKLPHHKPSKNSVGPAVWKGVSAAMGRLMQANTQIPDADRKAVYNHLAKHYDQFNKEPPDFKALQLMWSVAEGLLLMAPDSIGDVKGIAFNPKAVFDKLTELDTLLRAEPKTAPSATLLTQQLKLKRELEMRQRELALRNY